MEKRHRRRGLSVSTSLPDKMPSTSDLSDMRHHRCSKHQGDPITEFSILHQTCMCLRCATMQHEHYNDFVPVSEAVKMKREEASVLMEQMSEFAKATRSFQKDRRKFMDNINTAEKRIKGMVKKVKANLIRHIDILESKLVNTLSKLANDERKSMWNVLTEVQVLEKQLSSRKEHVTNSLKRGTDVDVITTIVEEKKGFEKLKQSYDIPEEKLAAKTLHLKLSPAINFFLEKVDFLGEVDFQYDDGSVASIDDHSSSIISPSLRNSLAPSKLSNYTSKSLYSHVSSKELYHRENGAVTMRRPNVDEISDSFTPVDRVGNTKASIVFTAEHDEPCTLTGVVALDSGLIAVADAKHRRVQLVNRNSEILDDLIFHYTPCCLTRVSDTSFAMSFNHKDFISIFDVARYRFLHVKDLRISGNGGSYAIAFSKNKYAVCRKGEIRIMSTDDGTLLQTIPVKPAFPQIAMTEGGTMIYMTDIINNKIVCMTDSGKCLWEFSKGHVQPCSLALDLNQLFIADLLGRVFILSTYGDLIKEINCGGHLRAISVDKASGNVLLTQESRDKIRSRTIKIVSV